MGNARNNVAALKYNGFRRFFGLDTKDENGKQVVVVLADFSMLYHTYLEEECRP